MATNIAVYCLKFAKYCDLERRIIVDASKNYRFFYTPTKFAEENFIVCDGMGYENNPNFLIDRSYFNNYLMMFVLSNQIFVEQDDVRYTIHQNQGIIMDLTKRHKYYFDKSSGGCIIWLHFRGMPCASIMQQLNLKKKLPAVFSSERVYSLTKDIFECSADFGDSTEYLISTKVYSLLYELLKGELADALSNQDDLSDPFITLVKGYISSNIANDFSLEELASFVGISKFHFSHKFKQKFHMTLTSYLINCKIVIAEQLLSCTNDSIAQIAQGLNFNDQSYFTNIFKRTTGITPSEYRKQK